jgi:NAD-dependent SIR2 family protein deacetylase
MSNAFPLSQVTSDDFARRFALRAPNLMWLLGAGASASAGLPTALDMILEFKQRLYASQRRISPQMVADLSSPVVRAQLQAYIDSSGGYPAPGAPEEYAALFEAVYAAESDRRAYIDSKVSGAKPSYGHLALATLMRANRSRLVWTTNFDSLLADACAKVYDGTGPLSIVALDAPELATQLIGAERWPIEVKLHGDFRSRRLKNTNDELRHQDARLRQVLVQACQRFGLVVVGYSGRDESVMSALEEATKQPNAFPAGVFWLHRGEEPPLPSVANFLTRAQSQKVDAAIVAIENFDEVMRDLVRLQSGLDTTVLDAFASGRRRWSGAPRQTGNRTWPVVRLNALPITLAPSVCRKVVCDVGGYADAWEAVEKAGVDILVARVHAGVLAYGSDEAVRTAFAPHGIEQFDLHTIELKRLRYDSGERGLLRAALTRAIARERALQVLRRRSADLLAPADPTNRVWQPLASLVGNVSGKVKNHSELEWREGVATRLDWADERLWLVIEPRIVFHGITLQNKSHAADFARERTVKRYNAHLNELIEYWSTLLAGDDADLRALCVADGVDAVFRLSRETAYSWRSAL